MNHPRRTSDPQQAVMDNNSIIDGWSDVPSDSSSLSTVSHTTTGEPSSSTLVATTVDTAAPTKRKRHSPARFQIAPNEKGSRTSKASSQVKKSNPPAKRGRPTVLVKKLEDRFWLLANDKKTEYNMMLAIKEVEDNEIDIDVKRRGDETPAKLLQQVYREIDEAEKRNCYDTEWVIEYIVAATKNKKFITKYYGYPVPSVVDFLKVFDPTTCPIKEIRVFWVREERLQMVVDRIILEMGAEQYNKIYPNRYAPYEKGATVSTFVTKPVTLHKNRLRAIEWRLTFECDKVNLPPIQVENWTDNIDAPMPEFTYTHALIPSKGVKEIIAKYRNKCTATARCGEDGACKENPCVSFIHNAARKRECGCKIVVTSKSGNDVWRRVRTECTEECECDPTTCGNKIVQKGRQFPLQLFFDAEKYWTVRALTKIAEGTFVGEYTGEVLTFEEAEKRGSMKYFMDMPRNLKTEENSEEMGCLYIDAQFYGNETRFISHSCNPNLELTPCYVERYGEWYARMTFIAKKDIEIGEELTFDYFPDCKRNGNVHFDKCLCKSERCKFKDDDEEKKRRKEEKKRKVALSMGFDNEKNKVIEENRRKSMQSRADRRQRRESKMRKRMEGEMNKENGEVEDDQME